MAARVVVLELARLVFVSHYHKDGHETVKSFLRRHIQTYAFIVDCIFTSTQFIEKPSIVLLLLASQNWLPLLGNLWLFPHLSLIVELAYWQKLPIDHIYDVSIFTVFGKSWFAIELELGGRPGSRFHNLSFIQSISLTLVYSLFLRVPCVLLILRSI